MIRALRPGASFDELARQPSVTGPVLVKFYGPNCGPCAALAPLLHQLEAQIPGLTIVAVDIALHPEVGMAHQVGSIPTLVIYRGGAVRARYDGSPGTAAGLRAFVAPHVGAA